MQEEVVESEDTVLENRLTYKKRCVLCVAWVGKGKVGGRGQGVERDVDATTSSSPPQVCGTRKGRDGHTQPH